MADPEAVQRRVLQQLLIEAQDTEYGRRYQFGSLDSYEAFREKIPVCDPLRMDREMTRAKEGESDIFWPGTVRRYAVSAGTTGKGTHLPLTPSRIDSDRRFLRKVAWNYLRQRPNIFPLLGTHLSLPGSLERHGRVEIGEISAYTALEAPHWLRTFQLVSPEILTGLPFREKMQRIIREAAKADLRVITAVPSWLLTLFQQCLERTGKDTIAELWPNLRLIVTGGVKLANYRPFLDALTGELQPDYVETYGASEGYFAFRDSLESEDLRLVLDNGIFFELIPDPLPDTGSSAIQQTLPLWEADTGREYGLLVTTNAGLWRYTVNDVVRFRSLHPPRIEVAGRVNEMLDDFGEAVSGTQIGIIARKTAVEMNLEIACAAVGGLLQSGHDTPRHHWFFQIDRPLAADRLEELALACDRHLQEANRHYAIRRQSNALARPMAHTLSQPEIMGWLEQSGRTGAQAKMPAVLGRDAVRYYLGT